MEKVEKVVKRIQDQVEAELQNGHPYVIISLKRVRDESNLVKGLENETLISKLKDHYRVGKDGTWLIIEGKRGQR